MLFENIAGHACAKRAIEIAVAGDHSILFVGPRGAGKGALIEALHNLRAEMWDGNLGHLTVKAHARAVLACWCGADNLTRACECSEGAQARYKRRLRTLGHDYDLHIEVSGVPYKEYGARPGERGTSVQAMGRALPVRMLQQERHEPWTVDALMGQLDDPARRTLEMAARRLGFACGDVDKVLRVARTIADLDGAKGITGRCLAEAVQYRALIRG